MSFNSFLLPHLPLLLFLVCCKYQQLSIILPFLCLTCSDIYICRLFSFFLPLFRGIRVAATADTITNHPESGGQHKLNMFRYICTHIVTKISIISFSFSQSQGREIASLRTRNVELEGDVERLRRHLTNERFERSVI